MEDVKQCNMKENVGGHWVAYELSKRHQPAGQVTMKKSRRECECRSNEGSEFDLSSGNQLYFTKIV